MSQNKTSNSELDEKLEIILVKHTHHLDTLEPRKGKLPTEMTIAAIKHAFIDAGWQDMSGLNWIAVNPDQDSTHFMTGAEWLARFEKELALGHAFDIRTVSAITKAAKRASGIAGLDSDNEKS